MARIRTIKPEFWTNERVMECSMNARLMFIGMWNFADDNGRLSLSAKTIKAQIFPSDNLSSENILGMIRELSANGLVLIYAVDEKDYLQIVGWQHQRIDKPQPGKHPGPTNGYSTNIPGIVEEQSKSIPALSYLKGEEGKGEELSIPPADAGPPKHSRKKPKLPMPDIFPLTEKSRGYAAEHGFVGDRADQLFSKFKNYHQSKGSMFASWEAAWRTWVDNEVSYQRPKQADDDVYRNVL